jgi:uncharacterized protein (DUF58 family)
VQPTRRYWEALAVAATLAAAALVFARPLLLLAPAGIAAFLLAGQFAFVDAVGRLADSLAVTQRLDRRATVTGDPVTVTLRAEGEDAGLRTEVTAHPSAGLDAAGDRTTTPGEETAFTVESAVAGTHRLEAPTVAVADPAGLFTERFERGDERELVVEARRPSDVHVGAGGRALPDTFGEHPLDSTGPGIMPAELRQYVAGEPASHIDWKATARLARPFIREFEAESDRTTLLVVDARPGLRVGPPGATALEYLRTLAIAHLSVARRLGDPVGCVGVDDTGVRRLVAPTNAARGYEIARRRLLGLTATSGPSRPRASLPIQRRPGRYDPGTRFGEVLASYAAARPAADPESKPLQAAVRTAIASLSGSVRVVVYTDDADRAGVREVVSDVRHGGYSLEFFVAPRVLFEPDTFADLAGATERYEDFERFRRRLVAIDDVAAYEVAPRSRIETVLEQRRATARE